MTLTDKDLGKKLKFIRELKKINRKEFVDLLNKELSKNNLSYSPISEKVLYNYESGLKVFTAIFLDICCKVLNINHDYFFANISEIITKKDSPYFFDSKNLALLRLRFRTLMDILEKLNNKELANKFIKFLDNFN